MAELAIPASRASLMLARPAVAFRCRLTCHFAIHHPLLSVILASLVRCSDIKSNSMRSGQEAIEEKGNEQRNLTNLDHEFKLETPSNLELSTILM